MIFLFNVWMFFIIILDKDKDFIFKRKGKIERWEVIFKGKYLVEVI